LGRALRSAVIRSSGPEVSLAVDGRGSLYLGKAARYMDDSVEAIVWSVAIALLTKPGRALREY
jgi:hypothetical protein